MAELILEVLPTADAKQKYIAAQTEELNSQIVMPGLINTHCHTSSRLFRGLENNLQPAHWLATNNAKPDPIFLIQTSSQIVPNLLLPK